MNASAPDGAPATATEFLGRDHRRLDAIFADVKRCLAGGDLAGATARFEAFRAGLDRHIEAEERVLFPAFETLTGAARGGPTHVMRAEHAEIRRLMAEIAANLACENGVDRTTPLASLTARLFAHNGKEERILYPATDQAVGDGAAREELVRKLQSFWP